MISRSPGTPRRTTSADDQDELRIRSYYNKQLKIFPKIQNISLLTDLDLSHNSFVDFAGMTSMPSLTRLNVSHTNIQTFIGAVEQESLIQLMALKTPLSSHSFFNLMCLIVFGPQLQIVNKSKITSADVKQCKRYKEHLLPYLLKGWLIMNLIPNVIIYEVKTQKRRRLFLKLPPEEEFIPKSTRKPTKHVPLKSPMTLRKRCVYNDENCNMDQNDNQDMESNESQSKRNDMKKGKHSATPDVRKIKDIEANAALEHQQNANQNQQMSSIIETPSRQQSAENFELSLVKTPVSSSETSHLKAQKENIIKANSIKSTMKPQASTKPKTLCGSPTRSKTPNGRLSSTTSKRVPLTSKRRNPNLKVKSAKENVDTSNRIVTSPIKSTPRRRSASPCLIETPSNARRSFIEEDYIPSNVDSPEYENGVPSPKENTEVIEKVISQKASATDAPKKIVPESIMKKSKSPLRIGTTFEFSTVFNAPLTKTESPLRVQGNDDVNIEILPAPVPSVLKIERSPSITRYIPSSPLCSPPSTPPSCFGGKYSPPMMSSSSPLPSPDEFEKSDHSSFQWPERQTPKRVVIKFDVIDDKSDSSFDVTDLGLPLFAND